MIALLAGLLGPRFAWLARPLVYAAAVGAAVLALWLWGNSRYHAGVHDERTAWELKVERDKAAQTARERQADQNLQQQKARDDAEAARRRQEIDDATRNLPDQAPSARQRARACLELRRQAAASGRPQPAC